ncbi:MAG: hypothetical protein KAR07_03520 [Spirochaetes bacterium]|nr:hypothetical protein [Spirochaetota bacterium]
MRKRPPSFIFLIIILSILISNCTEEQTIAYNVFADDDKVAQVYNWLENMQMTSGETIGLLQTEEDSYLVSTYGNAMAAIVFSVKGNFLRAEQIFDYYNARLNSEMLQHPGGYFMLRYSSGVPVKQEFYRWIGDNAWLLIALNNYHYLKGVNTYTNMTTAIENWLRSLQNPTNGSIWGGYDPDTNKLYVVIEGNIDVFNAVYGYDDFHKNLLNYFKTDCWEAGTTSIIIPNYYYKYSLDLHSWGYCAFSSDFSTGLLTSADRFVCTQTATVNGKIVTGYCFDEDRDTIWFEGTGEMVVAFYTAGLINQAAYYLQEIEKVLIPSSKYPNSAALPYASNPGTIFAQNGNLWDGADTELSLAPATWYILAKLGYDPMGPGRRSIPEEDKFWK